MSLRRVAMLLVCALAAMGLGRQLTFRELLIFMVGLASCYSMLGIAAEIVLGTFRPWASDYRFAGTVHPNEQGMLCGATMVGAIMLAIEFPRFRLLLWGLACAAAVGLLLSKSRTAHCLLGLLPHALLYVTSARPILASCIHFGQLLAREPCRGHFRYSVTVPGRLSRDRAHGAFRGRH